MSVRDGWGSPMATVTPPRRAARKAASSTAGTPAASKVTSAPPPVTSFTPCSASSGAKAWVAPSSRASWRLAATGSTATMVTAPATCAAITEARPTPPSPKTATDWPGRTAAVLSTAPAPVSTAQPKSAAVWSGTSAGMTTADSRATTAWRANPEMPRWWWTTLPVPIPEQRGAVEERPGAVGGRARRAERRAPRRALRAGPAARHEGEHHVIAGPTSRTPGPTSSTTPAASWPSAMGSGRTREPSTTETSEWQTPAASTRMRSSPARGAPSSTSSSWSGLDVV